MKPIAVIRGRGVLDTQTVTTGTQGVGPNRQRGFRTATYGSIADGTSNIYAGAAVTDLYWDENGAGGAEKLVLSITGATNVGWTQMVIDGATTFLRTSAAFGGGIWTWNGIVTNPFGVGGNHPCVFS